MRALRFLIIYLFIFIPSALSAQWVYEDNLSGYLVTPLYVNMVDSSVAWIVGEQGFPPDTSAMFNRTSGRGWNELSWLPFMASDKITCVAAHDSMNAWIGTATGKIFFTTDMGNNWTQQVSLGGQSYFNDIKFSRINPQYGYAFSDPPGGFGTPAIILKTTNGGGNWTEMHVSIGSQYLGAAMSSCVTDSNHAWFGLNCQYLGCHVPQVVFTTNGGVNWNISTIPNNSDYVSALAFRYDNTFGISAPWDAVPTLLYRSVNGAVNWSLLYNTQGDAIVAGLVWAPYTSVWYFCTYQLGEGNNIYKSSDNGSSWQVMNVPFQQDNQPNHIDAITQNNRIYATAITYQGLVVRLVDSAYAIGIQQTETGIPKKFKVYQNYPNPFNPTSVIRFDLPKGGNVFLKVYDVLGKEVYSLSEFRQAGSFEFKFDGTKLASGLYFYRIQAGSFVDTKKMVLIK